MSTDPKARAFEVCWQQIQAGAGLEQVLEQYPQWASELRPLLYLAKQTEQAGQTIAAPADAQERSKTAFLAQARRLGTGQGSPASRAEVHRRPASRRKGLGLAWRFSLVTLAVLLVVTFSVRQSVMAASQALPGDVLYTVKLATERTRLLLTKDPAERLEMEESFDQERAEEVQLLVQNARTGQVTFSGPLLGLRPGVWLVDDFQVQIPPDAQVVGEIRPGIYVTVLGQVQRDGTVIARRVQAREYYLAGVLEKITGQEWMVAGVPVTVTPDTVVVGSPALGETLRVTAFLLADKSLLARLVEANQPALRAHTAEIITTPTQNNPEPARGSETRIPPKKTDIAESTEKPQPTEADPTEASEPIEKPQPTEVNPTEASEPTEKPQPTEVDPTEAPEPTEKPQPTEAHPTEAPEPTEKPQPTEVHPTEAPEPTESHSAQGARLTNLPKS